MAYRGLILLLVLGCQGGGGGLAVELPDGSAVLADASDSGSDGPVAPPPDVAADLVVPGADMVALAEVGPLDFARLAIDPPAANFGFVSVQAGCEPSKVVTVRVKNTGAALSGPLTIELAAPFVVTGDGCSGQSLAGGTSCEVQVQFRPVVQSSHTGMLVARAAPGGQVQSVLTGLGGHGDALTLTPNNADFGPTMTGTTTPAQSFALKNTGGNPLAGKPALISTGDFVVTRDDCAITLAPGATCTVQVAFKPVTFGTKSAILILTTEGCGGGPVQALLSGTGVSAIDTSLSPINFGSLEVGAESAGQLRTITNTGGAPTGALSVAIAGQSASQFIINSNSCSASLAPGQSCDVRIAFHPTTVGDKFGQLLVTSATGGLITASLSGTGVCPRFALVTPKVANFPDTSAATPPVLPPRQTVTVGNRSCIPFGPLVLTIVGADAAAFELADNACTGKTLQDQEDCAVAVLFKPTTAGLKTAELQVSVGGQVSLTALLGGVGL